MRLVLVHSSGLGPRQWSRLLRLWGGEAEVPALTGYAGVPMSDAPHWHDDLAVLRATVRPGDLVFGHSYGGFLALQLAMELPLAGLLVHEPVAVGVLGPTEIGDEDFFALPPGGPSAWISRLVDWWNGPGAWDALPAAARAPFERHAAKVHAEVVTIGRDRTPAEAYAAIGCPLVVCSGSTSRDEAQTMCDEVARGAGAERRVLEGLGHMAPVTHPGAFVDILRGLGA